MDNSFLANVIAALIGTTAVIVVAYLTSRQSRELEKQKWQQDLLLAKQNSVQTIELERQKHAQELEQQRLRLTQELRADYDKSVRQHCIHTYKSLWQITGQFPKYGRSDSTTITSTQRFSIDL